MTARHIITLATHPPAFAGPADNLWGWQDYYGLEWCFDDNLCWIRQTRPYQICWAPVGDWNAVDWKNLLPCSFSETAHTIVRVPEKLLHTWQEHLPGLVDPEEDRGQWEYLYKQEELADLPGNRYHKKRNHYNSYIKTYGEPDYHSLDDAMVEDVLAVQDDWCQWHECEDSPSLRAENEAINRVLSHWNSFRQAWADPSMWTEKWWPSALAKTWTAKASAFIMKKASAASRACTRPSTARFPAAPERASHHKSRAQDLDEGLPGQNDLFARRFSAQVLGLASAKPDSGLFAKSDGMSRCSGDAARDQSPWPASCGPGLALCPPAVHTFSGSNPQSRSSGGGCRR